eukprot:gene16613-19733_t
METTPHCNRLSANEEVMRERVGGETEAVRRAFICPDYLKEVWKAAECDKTWDDLTEDDVLHLAAVHPHGSLSQLYLKNRSAYTIYPTLDSLGTAFLELPSQVPCSFGALPSLD